MDRQCNREEGIVERQRKSFSLPPKLSTYYTTALLHFRAYRCVIILYRSKLYTVYNNIVYILYTIYFDKPSRNQKTFLAVRSVLLKAFSELIDREKNRQETARA